MKEKVSPSRLDKTSSQRCTGRISSNPTALFEHILLRKHTQLLNAVGCKQISPIEFQQLVVVEALSTGQA